MASLFSGRRRRSPEDDGDGSGSGRAKRRRISPGADEADVAAEGAEGSSPGWLSTVFSGAKRVLSAVLFSSSEEQTSGEEEDEEEGSQADDDGNEDPHNSDEAIVTYSESKLAIEEMVMKESFSRDECDKMVRLLQSRVTDSTYPEAYESRTPNELPRRKTGSGHDFTGAWRSLNHSSRSPDAGPFSSVGPGYFSPGSPLQASPELCNAAVMEAKRWLEEKRHGLSTKPENHGPCSLNTDMLNSASANPLEDDKGSPVDVAKSYMQSLPPWQSPLLGSRKFKTPPSSGVHINVYERKSKLFSSAKVNTDEDFLSSAKLKEDLDELRRARIKSSETYLEASIHGSTSRLFDNDVSIFSSGTREEVGGQSYKGSGKAAPAEPANGCSLPTAPTKDGNDGAVDSVDLAPKDSDNLVQECHPAPEVHRDEAAQGNHMPLTSATKDVVDHSEGVKSVPAEPEIREESHMNSTSESRPKDAGPQTQMSLRSSVKKKVQTSLSGSTNKTSANGLVDRSDGNSGVESSGNDNPGCTNSSSAVPPNGNEFISSTADAADGNCADKNGTRKDSEEPVEGNSVENGAGMHPEEPPPKPLRRGRKRVVRRS